MTYFQSRSSMLAATFIACLAALALSACGAQGTYVEADLSGEIYETIESGMTYEQVVEIVGAEGELIDDEGRDTYAWSGPGNRQLFVFVSEGTVTGKGGSGPSSSASFTISGEGE